MAPRAPSLPSPRGAGGLATYLHADQWADAFPQAHTVAMPDSGFFADWSAPQRIASQSLYDKIPSTKIHLRFPHPKIDGRFSFAIDLHGCGDRFPIPAGCTLGSAIVWETADTRSVSYAWPLPMRVLQSSSQPWHIAGFESESCISSGANLAAEENALCCKH